MANTKDGRELVMRLNCILNINKSFKTSDLNKDEKTLVLIPVS